MKTKEELRKEYHEIWDKIRYRRISEVELITSVIVNILEKYIHNRLFFHEDCEKINFLFKKLKQGNEITFIKFVWEYRIYYEVR